MAGVGERLKDEREARNATIEDLSAATGIQLRYLEALERNEFQALPGRAFGKLYIRAYAETLGFDPQMLIDAYDREHQAARRTSVVPPRPEPVQPRRVEAVIARWREATMAERNRAHRRPVPVAAEQDGPSGTPSDSPSDVRDDEALEDREEELVQDSRTEPAEAWRDEAAAIERDGAAEPEEAATGVSVSEATVRPTVTESRPRRPMVVALLLSGLLLGAAGTFFTLFRSGIEESGPASTEASQREVPGRDPPPVASDRTRPSAPFAEPRAAPRPTGVEVAGTEGPSPLSVPEFGVGRRIVKRRLEGRGARFAQRDVVWFSTRVRGGEPGVTIRHVWIHEGRVLHAIELGLGGPDWRTHSRKTLHAAGRWAVEAHDEQGRVLARETFTCSPAAR